MKTTARRTALSFVAILWSGAPAGFALYLIGSIATGSTFSRGDAAYVSMAVPFVIMGVLFALGVGILAMPRLAVRIILGAAGVASLCFVAVAAKYWHYDCVIRHGGFKSGVPSCAVVTPLNLLALIYAIYAAVFLIWAWRASKMAAASEAGMPPRTFAIMVVGWVFWTAPPLALLVPFIVLFAVFGAFGPGAGFGAATVSLLSPVLIIGMLVAMPVSSLIPSKIAGRILLIAGAVVGCGLTVILLTRHGVQCAPLHLQHDQNPMCADLSLFDFGLEAYAAGLVVIAVFASGLKPDSAVSSTPL